MSGILTATALQRLLSDPARAEACSVAGSDPAPFVIVDLDSGAFDDTAPRVQPACTVIGFARTADARLPAVADVIARSEAELEALCAAVRRNPVAASVLAQVLRHNETVSVANGLLVESLAYSTLQHGGEFAAWLSRRPASPPESGPAPAEPVLLAREGDDLHITLNRPDQRNAFSVALRDALCAALDVPLGDPRIERILIRGAGPAFCAGGDLLEFGSARDAALAHATRMTRSAGALLHRLSSRIVCEVQGACIGAGIELPAFGARIRARPDAFFQLPEVAMGLIPGAGGTVSIVRRIGRLRTARLALTGARIDTATALAWGLIDEVVAAFD